VALAKFSEGVKMFIEPGRIDLPPRLWFLLQGKQRSGSTQQSEIEFPPIHLPSDQSPIVGVALPIARTTFRSCDRDRSINE
jgi:hypothetical protein